MTIGPNGSNVIVEPTGSALPMYLTVVEAAGLLRTTPKGVYSMIERGQMPGVVRPLPRKILIRTKELLDFLDHNCASSAPRRGR